MMTQDDLEENEGVTRRGRRVQETGVGCRSLRRPEGRPGEGRHGGQRVSREPGAGGWAVKEGTLAATSPSSCPQGVHHPPVCPEHTCVDRVPGPPPGACSLSIRSLKSSSLRKGAWHVSRAHGTGGSWSSPCFNRSKAEHRQAAAPPREASHPCGHGRRATWRGEAGMGAGAGVPDVHLEEDWGAAPSVPPRPAQGPLPPRTTPSSQAVAPEGRGHRPCVCPAQSWTPWRWPDGRGPQGTRSPETHGRPRRRGQATGAWLEAPPRLGLWPPRRAPPGLSQTPGPAPSPPGAGDGSSSVSVHR